jgi:hypothetical protein
MKRLRIACLAAASVFSVLLPTVRALAAPVPPEVKSIVTFVFAPGPVPGVFVPQGTGFFVGIKDAQHPELAHVYLVTAKHVLQTADLKNWLPEIVLRLNSKRGEADIAPIRLSGSGPKKNVFTHPSDESVDIAVVPCLPNEKVIDFRWLSEDFAVSQKEFADLGIREGSDVFFTGMFTPYLGSKRNYPIVRFGRVALISDEKIKFVDGEADLYLVETGSFGGNSRSPVFFYLGSDRNPGNLIAGPPILKLAGIMKGSFLDGQPVVAADTAVQGIARSSMGIAAVVPAFKLWEIFAGAELPGKGKPR